MTSKLTITRERLEKIKSWRETYGAGSNVMLPTEEAEELARTLEDARIAIEERRKELHGGFFKPGGQIQSAFSAAVE